MLRKNNNCVQKYIYIIFLFFITKSNNAKSKQLKPISSCHQVFCVKRMSRLAYQSCWLLRLSLCRLSISFKSDRALCSS